MPMQEFLASYAVQVDEDGARRLQSILDRNRESGANLAAAFSSARQAVAGLKRELSESSGLQDALAGLFSGLPQLPAVPGAPVSAFPASASGIRDGLLPGSSRLSVGADFSPADEALSEFRSRLEAERPRLSVNPSGITGAVSSAAASVRTQLSALRISVPVTAVPTLDTTGLTFPGAAPEGESAQPPSANRGPQVPENTLAPAPTSALQLETFPRPDVLPAFDREVPMSAPNAASINGAVSPKEILPMKDGQRVLESLHSFLAGLSGSIPQVLLSGLLRDQPSFVSYAPQEAPAGPQDSPAAPFPNSLSSASPRRETFPQILDTLSARFPLSTRAPALTVDSHRFSPRELSTVPPREKMAGDASALQPTHSLISALADLTAAARTAFLQPSAAVPPVSQSVQAPINIHVTSHEAAPEAIAQSLVNTAQRSLLKTLKGVFA